MSYIQGGEPRAAPGAGGGRAGEGGAELHHAGLQRQLWHHAQVRGALWAAGHLLTLTESLSQVDTPGLPPHRGYHQQRPGHRRGGWTGLRHLDHHRAPHQGGCWSQGVESVAYILDYDVTSDGDMRVPAGELC